jgi:CHASE3 domain sensor protein
MSDVVTPRPDPTALTTEQLRRELQSLRELLTTQIEGLRALHNERFTAMRDSADAQSASNATAAGKLESSTAKLLDNLQRQIDDLKGRASQADGAVKANSEASLSAGRNTTMIVGVGLLIAAVLSLFVAWNAHQIAAPATIVAPAVVPVH